MTLITSSNVLFWKFEKKIHNIFLLSIKKNTLCKVLTKIFINNLTIKKERLVGWHTGAFVQPSQKVKCRKKKLLVYFRFLTFFVQFNDKFDYFLILYSVFKCSYNWALSLICVSFIFIIYEIFHTSFNIMLNSLTLKLQWTAALCKLEEQL